MVQCVDCDIQSKNVEGWYAQFVSNEKISCKDDKEKIENSIAL